MGHAPPPPGAGAGLHSGFSSSCGTLPAMGNAPAAAAGNPLGRPAPRPPNEKAPAPPGSQGGYGPGGIGGPNKKSLKPHPGLLRQSYHVRIYLF